MNNKDIDINRVFKIDGYPDFDNKFEERKNLFGNSNRPDVDKGGLRNYFWFKIFESLEN